jgi:hypothetical protein
MALSPLPTEGNTMMVKVVCTCGHSGVVNAETLPRELTCSRCGSSRRVETKEGARIRNPVAVMERILGEARPIGAAGGG